MNSLGKFFALSLLLTLLAACTPTTAPATAPLTEATTIPEAAATEPAAQEASGAPGELPTGQRTYIIVPAESSAAYIVNEEFFGLALSKYGIPEGLVDTIGTTSAIEGQFQLNWDDLSAPLGENTFTVDLSTLQSNQNLRDGWIRDDGPKFSTYPNATFVAESLEGAPTTYTPGEEVNFQMVGQLTIRDITQPTTFDITAKLENGSITGTATAPLKMSDFGITPPDFANTLTVADDFQVKVDFTAREQ